jgi:DNA invertase Pin-like site-specific DNA recombinase
MNSDGLIPAAQYVRMSTDRQEYSLANQKAAIAEYAALHGYVIVRTYEDPGRSGVVLKHRQGLKQLLSDATSSACPYRAVLVYDVSRWGRFQDNDEAAHYEFVCKSSGVQVHYCAEPFANDCTVPSLIMKALKRTMAGEYSRELGARIYQAQKRLVLMGFKMGARIGYGLRRKMVSVDPTRDRILADGEYKGIHNDHIVIVPGPPNEIAVVREIYAMYLRSKGRMGSKRIATELNRRGVPFVDKKPWDYHAVGQVLSNPKYTGSNVWGRTTQRLEAPQRWLEREEWVEKRRAFPPVIDIRTYDRVQRLRQQRKAGPTNEQLIGSLSQLLKRKGALTRRIIDQSRITPSLSLLRKRFGGLRRLYDLTGAAYRRDVFEIRQRGMDSERLRDGVVKQILETFPKNVAGFRTNSRRQRPILLIDDDFTVSVVVAREYETPFGKRGWTIHPVPQEFGQLTLLCQVNVARDRVLGLHVMPPLKMSVTQHKFDCSDPWFRSGKPCTLPEFYQTAIAAHATNVADESTGSIFHRGLIPLEHRYARRIG